MSRAPNIIELLLKGHKKGQESAIEASIRSGVPLVVEKNGKICYIKPKFKYVLVPIDTPSEKTKLL